MHILIVNYEYPPIGGGAATATEAIAKEFVRLGHRVVILTGGVKTLPVTSEENGIIVRRVTHFRRAIDRSSIAEMFLFLISGLIFVPSIIRKHQIERALVFFSLPSGPIGLLGRWMCGVRYVVSLRGGDVPGTEPSLDLIHRLTASIRRAVQRNSIAVVASSDGLRKMAEAADPSPVRVIPNGVDTEFFHPLPEGKSSERLRIVFVGRFQNQKNLPFLLEQFAGLKGNKFELHLVGDGPERKRLEHLAGRLGITESITWHGWLSRSELLGIYQSVDCLVNPSLYEGMSNAVLEAMACGLPVIASNVSGNAEVVTDSDTGFLFKLDRPTEFSSALARLQDIDLRRQMGARARSRAIKFFSWRNAAEEYLNVLSECGTAAKKQFPFGANWKSFYNRALTATNVAQAKRDFVDLTNGIDMHGRSFLDIGFGQGLSLLIATSMGAASVGCDVDPVCAEVLRKTQSGFFPDLARSEIPVVVGSILDDSIVSRLRSHAQDRTAGAYHIVHSWGALHHTGEMDRAIRNAASLVAPGGHFIIAVYARHWSSRFWKMIKWFYNHSPRWIQKVLVWMLYPVVYLAKLLVTRRNPLRQERGMDFYHDLVDWVGGYPYEYATPEEIRNLVEPLGFRLERFIPATVPTGCHQYVFSSGAT